LSRLFYIPFLYFTSEEVLKKEYKQVAVKLMCIDFNTKPVKLFLSGIFFLMVGVASHASEGVIYYGNADIVGKEHLFTPSEKKDTLKEQNSQAEIPSNDNPNIYIAENAKIYGKEHLYAKQNTSQKIVKKSFKTKRKTFEPVKNDIAEKDAPEEIAVVPDFPFEPFSPPYLQCCKELVVAALQNKSDKSETVSKTYRATYHGIENSNLSIYLPEQRHKLSTLAIQCGMLTLFSPNSPPLL